MDYIISVPDMHCEHCVARIQKALQNAGLNFRISLENHTVTISGCENCLNRALEALNDLGFTPTV